MQRRVLTTVFPDLEPYVESLDRKSTRLNSSHRCSSYAVLCLKKKANASADRQRTDSSVQAGTGFGLTPCTGSCTRGAALPTAATLGADTLSSNGQGVLTRTRK